MPDGIELMVIPSTSGTCMLAHGGIEAILTRFSGMSLGCDEQIIANQKHPKSQREFIASRYVSKLLASQLFDGAFEDWQVTYFNQCIPQLLHRSGQKIGAISISHSTEYIAVILNTNSSTVGVDVEKVKTRNTPREVLSLICQPHELAWYDDKPSLDRFYRLWTAKEAIVKTHQLGIWDAKKLISMLEFNEERVLSQHNTYDIGHFQSKDSTFMGTWAKAQ